MEKSTRNKLLLGAGILALIGFYLYKKKASTTTTTSSATNKIKTSSTSLPSTNVTKPTSTSIFDTIFNAGTKVASTLQNNTPSVVTSKTTPSIFTPKTTPSVITPKTTPSVVTPKTTPSVVTTPTTPIFVAPTTSGENIPNQNSKDLGRMPEGAAGGSFDMATTKDTTLENSNASLGTLTTAGHYWGPDSNPTGYVDMRYPPTIILDPNGVTGQEQTNLASDIYYQNYATPTTSTTPEIIDQNGMLSSDSNNQAANTYAQNYSNQQAYYSSNNYSSSNDNSSNYYSSNYYSSNYYGGGTAGGGGDNYRSHLYGLGQGGSISG